MSLLDAMMDDFTIIEKRRTPDGSGGFTVAYEESAPFKAAITLDTTMQAKIAEKQGVTSVYTVTTSKGVILDYHDIIKRKSDGKTFRITSDATDKATPSIAGLDMRQCSAEKWEVTSP